MSGHTFAIRQRPIVFSAQYDRHRFETEKSNRDKRNFKELMIELYDPPGDAYDRHIEAGDILFTVNDYARTSKKRGRAINAGQAQQPFVSASLNGLQATTALMKKLPNVHDELKKKLAVYQSITVVGGAVRSYTYDGKSLNQSDDPVVQIGGVHTMLNNGPKELFPGEYVIWSAPTNAEHQEHDKLDQGQSKTKKRLRTEGLDSVRGVCFDSLLVYVHKLAEFDKKTSADVLKKRVVDELTNKVLDFDVDGMFLFETYLAEKDALEWTVDTSTVPVLKELGVAKDLMVPFSSLMNMIYIGLKLKIAGPTKSKYYKKFCAVMDRTVQAAREADKFIYRRILGKCIRGGMPGEKFDILFTT